MTYATEILTATAGAFLVEFRHPKTGRMVFAYFRPYRANGTNYQTPANKRAQAFARRKNGKVWKRSGMTNGWTEV